MDGPTLPKAKYDKGSHFPTIVKNLLGYALLPWPRLVGWLILASSFWTHWILFVVGVVLVVVGDDMAAMMQNRRAR